MARYKVLRGVANNLAHSFASPMNHFGRDYTMCHLIRRSKLTGQRVFSVELMSRTLGPVELLTKPIVDACAHYCADFGRLVTENGSALDMISTATIEVTIRHGRTIEKAPRSLHGHATVRATIVDDRGREYAGVAIQPYECAGLRGGAA